jgi:hypothetical protein
MEYNYGGIPLAMFPSAFENMTDQEYMDNFMMTKSINKTMHSFVLGASFAVNF